MESYFTVKAMKLKVTMTQNNGSVNPMLPPYSRAGEASLREQCTTG